MIRTFVCGAVLSAGVLAAAVVYPHAQAPPVRVMQDVALTHVVKKVAPIMPPVVVAAKVSGIVAADVVVRADGTVESVTILAGLEILRPAVADALKQWTFRPFLDRGQPARAVAVVEVAVGTPDSEDVRRTTAAYNQAMVDCRRALESSPPPPTACADALRVSEDLPPGSYLLRSIALSARGHVLILNGRLQEALTHFERAADLVRQGAGPADGDLAALYQNIAFAQLALGDRERADESYGLAVRILEALVARYPYTQLFRERLHTALGRYVEVKRASGNEAAARALEAKAAGLALPPPDAPLPFRIVDGVPSIGQGAPYLTADHIRQVRALVRAPARGPWLVNVRQRSELRWSIRAYLEPDVATPIIRRGRVLVAETALSVDAGYDQATAWKDMQIHMYYAQVPLKGRAAEDILNERDLNQPFNVIEPGPDALTDGEIVSIVEFLRARTVSSQAGDVVDRTRLQSDLQPWPIETMYGSSAKTIAVTLNRGGPVMPRQQRVTLRREGGTWTITALE